MTFSDPHPAQREPRFRARTGLAALLAAVTLAACGSQAAPDTTAPPPPQVSVATVLPELVRQRDAFTGRVAAVEAVELRARVSGYVERVAFTEGQTVHAGDLLFVIDTRPYRAALDRAQADLARARSEAQLATAQNVRAKALAQAQAISREELETRSATAAQRNAMVRAAEAAVATARLDLQFTEVRSPIDGRTGRALVTTGNLAQADATVLTTVVSQDPVHVHFDVDERTWLRYARGAGNRNLASTQNTVRVGLTGDAELPYSGVLDFIDNRIGQTTGTLHARAVLPNPGGVLTPGLFARVELEGSDAFEVLLITDKAVLTDQDRKYVYVVDAHGTAQRRDVVLGPVVDGLRIVEQGLAAGERVIVNGLQKVHMTGMPVEPQAVGMRAGDTVRVASVTP